ncbi:MAG: site-2 protease family protein [Patescibacteria group bacterium]|jgi:Zn-dependent protease
MSLAFFTIVVFIFSAIAHEYMHGWAADELGDPTAKQAGRLTLNPLAHIDLFGSVILPAVLFIGSAGQLVLGYAKPVPYNPANLRNPKIDSSKVALAGPAINLVLALFFGLFLRFSNLDPQSFLSSAFQIIVSINLLLMVFNLLPIPPLDGFSAIMPFLPLTWQMKAMRLANQGMILVFLVVFLAFPVIALIVNALFRLIVG